MATVNLNDLRIKNAKNLIASLNDSVDGAPTNANGYIFIGRPTPWVTGDTNPPTPTNNFEDFYNTYDQMLSLRRVRDTDAYHMLPRYKWASGTTYDIYNPNYSSQSKSFSGQTNLYEAVYFVENTNHSVYVCLDNNKNVTSTVEPQDAGDEPFYTSDGYQWLRVYDIPTADITDYATENYIPIVANNVTNTQSGAVYTVIIDSPGTNYTSNPGGFTNQLNHYYCNIVGDGRGAVARVSVNVGAITQIEVVRFGSGYSEGKLQFKSGFVYGSLVDLDAGINGLNPLGDGNFRSTVIIGPPGGWGTDLARELGGTRVGMFAALGTDDLDFDFLEGLTFRQVGIIQDPQFNPNVTNTETTLSATYAMKYENSTGTPFPVGGTITLAANVLGQLVAASGIVVENDTVNEILKYVQIPNQHSDLNNGVFYTFQEIAAEAEGQLIVSNPNVTTSSTATPQLDYNGLHYGMFFQDGFADPDIVKYSGLMTYLTNISPVERIDNQTEKISLLIGY